MEISAALGRIVPPMPRLGLSGLSRTGQKGRLRARSAPGSG